MGFVQTIKNTCLYVASEGELFMIGVHVDDLILPGKNNFKMAEVKKAFAECLEIKDMGELHYFWV
jgi:hypothetical protein